MNPRAGLRLGKKMLFGIAIALWLLLSAPFVLIFSSWVALTIPSLQPLSYFERRDPTTCPNYYDHIEDEVLACIHRAGEAQHAWVRTTMHWSSSVSYGEYYLAPFWVPLAVWAAIHILRRARRRFFQAS